MQICYTEGDVTKTYFKVHSLRPSDNGEGFDVEFKYDSNVEYIPFDNFVEALEEWDN